MEFLLKKVVPYAGTDPKSTVWEADSTAIELPSFHVLLIICKDKIKYTLVGFSGGI